MRLPAPTLRLVLLGLGILVAGGGCELIVSPGTLQNQQCGSGLKLCSLGAGGNNLDCVSTKNVEYGCALETCTPCDLPNAQPLCDPSGECAILSCDEMTDAKGNPIATWYDCNGDPGDGCEVNTLEDPKNCGTCGHPCPTDHAAPNGVLCEQGFCQANECVAGFSTCDGGSPICVPERSCGDGG